MKELFQYVLDKYKDAVYSSVDDVYNIITKRLPKEIEKVISNSKYIADGRMGTGTKSKVPYVSIFNSDITGSSKQGLYIVYLFKSDLSGFYISLNQGTTSFINKYGNSKGKKNVEKTADVLKELIEDDEFDKKIIDCGNESYDKANALSKFYKTGSFEENELKDDLLKFINIYEKLVKKLDENFSGYDDFINQIIGDNCVMNNDLLNKLKMETEELNPDSHDGSYEFTREVIKCYSKKENLLDVDYYDLNLIYDLVIGTWRQGIDVKKLIIDDGHISETDKENLKDLLDRIWEKAKNGEYTNRNNDEPSYGMFGTGFFSFEGKIKNEDVATFIKMCIDISDLDDDEEIFKICDKVLSKDIKGMGVASCSQILHCLKPFVFPIINGAQKKGCVFSKLGIVLLDRNSLKTYIDNCRLIKIFRDANFKFKNYRIIDLANDKVDELLVEPEKPKAGDEYSEEEFLKEVFIEKELYQEIKSVLLRKNNIILQGAPGVGKTFMAKRLAYSIIGKKNDDNVETIQFHQSYSYEDFIYGYQPDNGSFKLKEGIFYRFCKKAEEDPEGKYFFIIDEINRGNLSKIFGELLMLIESDKREKEYRMTLSHTHEEFYVPENVYIIGMMNTADRSLAIVDYALRRRFSFFTIKPAFNNEAFKEFLLDKKKCNKDLADKIIKKFRHLNEIIDNDPSLKEGFEIGHSYFCEKKIEELTEKVYKEIIKYDIKPILEEYWFDDLAKASGYIEELMN